MLECGAAGGIDQRFCIGLAHIGKAWPNPIIIDTTERVIGHQVDVVFEDDDVGELEVGVHAADGAGENESFGTEGAHHANGEGDFLE
jgi:hypothetical protein